MPPGSLYCLNNFLLWSCRESRRKVPRVSGAVREHLAECWRKTTSLHVESIDVISNVGMDIEQVQMKKMKLLFPAKTMALKGMSLGCEH